MNAKSSHQNIKEKQDNLHSLKLSSSIYLLITVVILTYI